MMHHLYWMRIAKIVVLMMLCKIVCLNYIGTIQITINLRRDGPPPTGLAMAGLGVVVTFF
jgi:hypothetical protein